MKRIIRGFFYYLLLVCWLTFGRNDDELSGKALVLGLVRAFATIGGFIGLGVGIGALVYLPMHSYHPNAQIIGFIGRGGAWGFFMWALSCAITVVVSFTGPPFDLDWPERLAEWAFAPKRKTP